jgi:hypothetical protein
MLDDLYADETESIIKDRIARPANEPPAPGRGFWAGVGATFSAPSKGIAAGEFEMVAHGADTFGAFGHTSAAYLSRTDPSLLFGGDTSPASVMSGWTQADETRAQADISLKKLQSGEAYSTELGSALRAASRKLMPDAFTANKAESILFGASRFISKAVGYSLVAGPAAGPVLMASDEGMTEADRLKAEGVDIGTRTKVGAIAGVSAGAAMALPIAGKTAVQTVGLYLAGGPLSFMAQQAASRAILQEADYTKVAQQYDPFDPVGLAVSTLIPLPFALHGYRAQRGAEKSPVPSDPAAGRALQDMGGNERLALKYDDPRLDAYTVAAAQREGIPPEALLAIKNVGEKSGPTAVSPKGAKGVMQFMDETWTAYGKGDPHDPAASIDAGARYMKDLIKQYDGDVRAAIAHYNGGGKAGKAVKEGRAAPAAETRKYLQRTDAYMAEHVGTEAGRAMATDPDAIAAARVQLIRNTIDSWNLKDPADVAGAQENLSAVLLAHEQLGASQSVDVSQTISLNSLSQARLLDELSGRLEQTRAGLLAEAGNLADPGAIKPLREQISQLEQTRPAMTDEAFRERAKEIQAEQGISYKAALSAAKKDINTRLDTVNAQIERLQQQVNTHRAAAEASQQIRHLDTQIAQVKADRAAVDAPTPKPMALAVKQAVPDMPAAKTETKLAQSGKKPAEPATKATVSAPDQSTSSANGKDNGDVAGPHLEAQMAEIARLYPDMEVQLDGMGEMRVAEAMEAVKAKVARDIKEAPLMRVAVECFLRNS